MFELGDAVGDDQPESGVHLRKLGNREPADLGGFLVVDAGFRLLRVACVPSVLTCQDAPHGGVHVPADIAVGVGHRSDRAGADERVHLDGQPGLLGDFPYRGIGDLLTWVDDAAYRCPASVIGALDQQDVRRGENRRVLRDVADDDRGDAGQPEWIVPDLLAEISDERWGSHGRRV